MVVYFSDFFVEYRNPFWKELTGTCVHIHLRRGIRLAIQIYLIVFHFFCVSWSMIRADKHELLYIFYNFTYCRRWNNSVYISFYFHFSSRRYGACDKYSQKYNVQRCKWTSLAQKKTSMQNAKHNTKRVQFCILICP